jgi:hypothetical protein
MGQWWSIFTYLTFRLYTKALTNFQTIRYRVIVLQLGAGSIQLLKMLFSHLVLLEPTSSYFTFTDCAFHFIKFRRLVLMIGYLSCYLIPDPNSFLILKVVTLCTRFASFLILGVIAHLYISRCMSLT